MKYFVSLLVAMTFVISCSKKSSSSDKEDSDSSSDKPKQKVTCLEAKTADAIPWQTTYSEGEVVMNGKTPDSWVLLSSQQDGLISGTIFSKTMAPTEVNCWLE